MRILNSSFRLGIAVALVFGCCDGFRAAVRFDATARVSVDWFTTAAVVQSASFGSYALNLHARIQAIQSRMDFSADYYLDRLLDHVRSESTSSLKRSSVNRELDQLWKKHPELIAPALDRLSGETFEVRQQTFASLERFLTRNPSYKISIKTTDPLLHRALSEDADRLAIPILKEMARRDLDLWHSSIRQANTFAWNGRWHEVYFLLENLIPEVPERKLEPNEVQGFMYLLDRVASHHPNTKLFFKILKQTLPTHPELVQAVLDIDGISRGRSFGGIPSKNLLALLPWHDADFTASTLKRFAGENSRGAERVSEAIDIYLQRDARKIDTKFLETFSPVGQLFADVALLHQVLIRLLFKRPDLFTPEARILLKSKWGQVEDYAYFEYLVRLVKDGPEAVLSEPSKLRDSFSYKGLSLRLDATDSFAFGLGDEVMLNRTLVDALVEFNPDIKLEVSTRRGALYGIWSEKDQSWISSDPAIHLVPVDQAANLSPAYPHHYRLNMQRWILQKLDLYNGHLHPEYRDTLKVFKQKNRYEQAYKVAYELGIPFRYGTHNRPTRFATSSHAGTAFWDQNVAARNPAGRPVVLFNPFGGSEESKGWKRTEVDDVRAVITELANRGYFVVVTPNHQSWGSPEQAELIVNALPESIRSQVSIAPRPTLSEKEFRMSDLLMRVDAIVTVEGGLMHLAYGHGKPFIALEAQGSPTAVMNEYMPSGADQNQIALALPYTAQEIGEALSDILPVKRSANEVEAAPRSELKAMVVRISGVAIIGAMLGAIAKADTPISAGVVNDIGLPAAFLEISGNVIWPGILLTAAAVVLVGLLRMISKYFSSTHVSYEASPERNWLTVLEYAFFIFLLGATAYFAIPGVREWVSEHVLPLSGSLFTGLLQSVVGLPRLDARLQRVRRAA